MTSPLIHDRGRGPELIGTRTTIYHLVPYFLDPAYGEADIAMSNGIRPDQVAAMRAYFLANYADVMDQHLRIEERISQGIEAQEQPEFRAKVEASRALMTRYRDWLAENKRHESTSAVSTVSTNEFPTFKEWLIAQDSNNTAGVISGVIIEVR